MKITDEMTQRAFAAYNAERRKQSHMNVHVHAACVRAALEAALGTEDDTEWEYTAKYAVGGVGGFTYMDEEDFWGMPTTDLAEAAETAARHSATVFRRRPGVPAGPWEPVPTEESRP